MGVIIAKFRKKTTYELLNELENDIKSIEYYRRSTTQTQKRMVAHVIFGSVCIYLLIALILCVNFFPESNYERVFFIVPLLIAPIILIPLKRTIEWYYNRKINRTRKKLTMLKDEKEKILERVMNKETYNEAKIILDKFGSESSDSEHYDM